MVPLRKPSTAALCHDLETAAARPAGRPAGAARGWHRRGDLGQPGLQPGGRWRIYAPYGLADVFNLVARPNPVLAPRHVYQAKTARWRQQWPGLTVLPWPEPSAARG